MSPWERRERGGLYYTRSRKVNGRVVREYIGTGTLGELWAKADAQYRRFRETEAEVHRKEWERLEAVAASVEELCDAAEVLARATLLAAGYHRHNRGEWRKRREGDKQR
jgi:hypothetical protein